MRSFSYFGIYLFKKFEIDRGYSTSKYFSYALENQPGTVITLAEVSFDVLCYNQIILSLKGGEM